MNHTAWRIFLIVTAALIVCGVAVYLLVALAFPERFDAVVAQQADADLRTLVARLAGTSTAHGISLIVEFCADHHALATLTAGGETTSYGSEPPTGTDTAFTLSGTVDFADGTSGLLAVTVPSTAHATISATFGQLLVPALAVIIVLSAVVSWVCNRMIARLEHSNAALRRESQAMRELEAQRSAFFAAASHELKTPVAVLRAQLEGMIMKLGDYADRDAQLPRALTTVDRMQRLVEETLLVSRMNGATPPRREPVDLNGLIDDAIDERRELAVLRAITFSTDVEPGARVHADRALMARAMGNIVGNAAAYATAGTIVTISADGESLSVANETDQRISPDDLARLGEALFRPDASRATASGGTGLGLHLTGLILEAHGFTPHISLDDGVFTYRIEWHGRR